MRNFLKVVGAAVLVAFMSAAGFAQDDVHKLALQISDNDPQKMNTVLNVAANVSRAYSEAGELVDIKIIAFNAGLHMLRTDTSPVSDRMKVFAESMPNVTFYACNNTRMSMAKKEDHDIPLFDNAEVVSAGVIELMNLDGEGYTIIRP